MVIRNAASCLFILDGNSLQRNIWINFFKIRTDFIFKKVLKGVMERDTDTGICVGTGFELFHLFYGLFFDLQKGSGTGYIDFSGIC